MAIEWAGTYMAPDDLSSLDWPSLEKIACVKFSETHRQTMLRALNAYIYATSLQQQAPRIKPLRSHLKKLETDARKLGKDLQASSTTAQAALALAFPWGIGEPTAVTHFLAQLSAKAADEAKRLSGAPGHPENISLDPLIRTWFTIYREAGGRGQGCYWHTHAKQYRGRFLNLLESAFYQANARVCSATVKGPPLIQVTRSSLAQAILPTIRATHKQNS
jgi:hypothetical protein